MARSTRLLRIASSDAEVFQREHVQNPVDGGVFVATIQAFESNETVRVEIVPTFSNKTPRVDGEIVHVVTRDVRGLVPPGAWRRSCSCSARRRACSSSIHGSTP